MKEAKAPVGRTEAGKTKTRVQGRNTRRVHATLRSLPGPLSDTSTTAFRLGSHVLLMPTPLSPCSIVQ